MHFDPIPLLAHGAVLLIEPAHETQGREARRVHGEVGFDFLQRQTAACAELAPAWREVPVLKVVEDGIEVRRLAGSTSVRTMP